MKTKRKVAMNCVLAMLLTLNLNIPAFAGVINESGKYNGYEFTYVNKAGTTYVESSLGYEDVSANVSINIIAYEKYYGSTGAMVGVRYLGTQRGTGYVVHNKSGITKVTYATFKNYVEGVIVKTNTVYS